MTEKPWMPFMKLFLLFLISLPAFSAVTTVAQSVHAPDGTLADGTALIRISKPCRSGSDYIGDKTVKVTFRAGAFSVGLVPNDTCSPSGYTGSSCPDCRTSYTVAWLLTDGTSHTETWVVPTSGSPVTVSSVIVTTNPVPNWMIVPAQIAGAGAGTFCYTSTNGVVAWLPCTGGSSSAATWSAMTSAWSTYTGAWSTYH